MRIQDAGVVLVHWQPVVVVTPISVSLAGAPKVFVVCDS
jgi:hypothetical protein